MLAYTVKAALSCKSLGSVVVNTDCNSIAALATSLGAGVYRRKASLARDSATNEHFNMDLIEALMPDTLVMINPVCPLLEPADIDRAISA